MEPGERMLLQCDGGPAMCQAVTYPPPVELEAAGGIYVLVDDGEPATWRYEFVPVTMLP